MDALLNNLTPDDSIGSDVNGAVPATNVGAVFLQSGGRFGGAFEFDRTSYLYISNDPFERDAPSTSGYSVSLWMYAYSTSSARVLEREYDNIVVSYGPGGVFCRSRSNAILDYVETPVFSPITLRQWYHVGCSWDASSGTLSLWVNGVFRTSIVRSDAIGEFYHSGDVRLGVGNRPFTNVDQGFEGRLDELVCWQRPLTASEWAGVASLSSALVPFVGVQFVSLPLRASEEFHGVFISTVMHRSSFSGSSGIAVDITTDDGLHWCELPVQTELSMISQGITPKCLFPAIRLKYRVRFLADVSIASLTFSFLYDPAPIPAFPVGINIAAPSYYTSEWHFVDVFLEGGAMLWPRTNIVYDEVDGYPREVVPGQTPRVESLLLNGHPRTHNHHHRSSTVSNQIFIALSASTSYPIIC
jgi:hypothetical protein